MGNGLQSFPLPGHGFQSDQQRVENHPRLLQTWMNYSLQSRLILLLTGPDFSPEERGQQPCSPAQPHGQHQRAASRSPASRSSATGLPGASSGLPGGLVQPPRAPSPKRCHRAERCDQTQLQRVSRDPSAPFGSCWLKRCSKAIFPGHSTCAFPQQAQTPPMTPTTSCQATGLCLLTEGGAEPACMEPAPRACALPFGTRL